MAAMTDDRLATLVAGLVKDSRNYRDTVLMPDRLRAQEYYDGVMEDTPSDDGRSKVISKDVRAAIKKVLPSIVRTILGNEKVVEYQPVEENDVPFAEQATVYVNEVISPECKVHEAISDAVHNALLLRNGILKWWYETKARISETLHTGLDQAAFEQLVSDDYVEVLEHTEREESVQTEGGIVPLIVHDVRIRRREVYRYIRVACIPMEEFLIHPDALEIEESPLVGWNTKLRRSDLVAMGYDRAFVEGLSTLEEDGSKDVEEFARRGVDTDLMDKTEDKSMEEIDYYELFVRVDYDGDGIAELRRICMAGGFKAGNILENEVFDEVPMADVVCERRPHQWEGQSLFDDIAEIQRIKTVLLRATLDNIYWQNNLQPTVQDGAVKNPESITQRNFGEPIIVKSTIPVNEAVGYATVPFVAKDAFQMLGYMDEAITDRTGISDAASGMAPDALQNMTAKATALIEQAGIGQVELIVRTIANGGVKRMFRGLLKMIVQHQDKPRTVRLRNQWVTFDPRSWNANMDAIVNTGLGAGTRERDMMVMQLIMGAQEKLLAAFGPDNPFVTADNVYNSVSKLTESAGLKSVDMFFTRPDPQEVQARLEAMKNRPDPEMTKAQATMAVEKFKAQVAAVLKDKEIEAARDKENAQRDADLIVKRAELEKDERLQAQEIAARERIEAANLAFQEKQLAITVMLEREKMDREDARAERQREADIQKTEAASIGKAFERNERDEAAQ